MRDTRFTLVVMIGLLALLVHPVRGQGKRGNSARENMQGGFERKAPNVGELLPDIALVDADGEEFHLRSLKENYSVLVFGCLT